jgi:hypothetical protein
VAAAGRAYMVVALPPPTSLRLSPAGALGSSLLSTMEMLLLLLPLQQPAALRAATNSRRVNWFNGTPSSSWSNTLTVVYYAADCGLTRDRGLCWLFRPAGGSWTVGKDGLNLAGWLAAHGPASEAPAITGTMPCCGCWGVAANGTFSSTGRCASATGSNASRQANALVRAAGLTIEPTGSFPVGFILDEGWMLPGSLQSAVTMLEEEGWTGLAIDNENLAKPSSLPEMFRRLLGNLSKVMTAANKSVVVDVCSTWSGDIGGPSHLAAYAQAAPTNIRFMDMAEYFAHGFIPGGVKAQLADLKTKYFSAPNQLHMIAPAVGLTEMPGHENASCGGWPQCANLSNPQCGCLNYGWNQSALAAFVIEVEKLGIREIDVWRQDSEYCFPAAPSFFVATHAS